METGLSERASGDRYGLWIFRKGSENIVGRLGLAKPTKSGKFISRTDLADSAVFPNQVDDQKSETPETPEDGILKSDITRPAPAFSDVPCFWTRSRTMLLTAVLAV